MDFELDNVLGSEPEQATQRVAVGWDDEGEPNAGFVIVGKDSEQYQGKYAEQRQKAIRRQAVKRTRFDLKTEEGAEQLDATVQQNNSELAVAVVVDWFGFTAGGKPAPFNKDHVKQMLEKRPSWRDKILTALEDEAAFLKQSPTKSSTTSRPTLVEAKEAKTG